MNGPRGLRAISKKRILVQDQGESGFQTAGIRLYVEDLEPGSNTEIGPKDFFEIACRNLWLLSEGSAGARLEESTPGAIEDRVAPSFLASGLLHHWGYP